MSQPRLDVILQKGIRLRDQRLLASKGKRETNEAFQARVGNIESIDMKILLQRCGVPVQDVSLEDKKFRLTFSNPIDSEMMDAICQNERFKSISEEGAASRKGNILEVSKSKLEGIVVYLHAPCSSVEQLVNMEKALSVGKEENTPFHERWGKSDTGIDVTSDIGGASRVFTVRPRTAIESALMNSSLLEAEAVMLAARGSIVDATELTDAYKSHFLVPRSAPSEPEPRSQSQSQSQHKTRSVF